MGTLQSRFEIIPSLAVKKIVFGLMLAFATRRQQTGPLTGQSTPRERNWPGPSPILPAGSEGAGSTAVNPGFAARRPAAGGRQTSS